MTVETIADVPQHMTLVNGPREVRHVLQQTGTETPERLNGGLFVSTAHGTYDRVYWFRGRVPFLNYPVERIV